MQIRLLTALAAAVLLAPASVAAQQQWSIFCRGPLTVSSVLAENQSATIRIAFAAAPRRAEAGGGALEPGQCGWPDRTLARDEPKLIEYAWWGRLTGGLDPASQDSVRFGLLFHFNQVLIVQCVSSPNCILEIPVARSGDALRSAAPHAITARFLQPEPPAQPPVKPTPLRK